MQRMGRGDQLSLNGLPLSLQLEHARSDDQPFCPQFLIGHPPGSVNGGRGTGQLLLAQHLRGAYAAAEGRGSFFLHDT